MLGSVRTMAAITLLPLPAAATPASMTEAIKKMFGTTPITEDKVRLDMPPLAENGNSVAMSIAVDSPMTRADHVRSLSVFAEKNPLPQVATYRFSPASGSARIATRIRLSGSQTILAIAKMNDGSLWSGSAKVIVTLAACIGPIS